jgi:HTH-type transcriptional regulator / antitoxin HipB
MARLQDPIRISSVSELGALIRARRREMKLRQADLSSISGVDQSNLSKIERSQIPATLETYLRLLEPLGIDLQAVPRE